MHVVWLDDDGEFLRLVADLAEPWNASGARLTTTSDPLEALGRAVPDLLVVDLAMPGTDGLSVLEAARRKDVPTVVVSGFAGGELRLVAEMEGAAAVWDKADLVRHFPQDPADLLG